MRLLKLNYRALRALLAVLVISVSTSGCTTKLAYDFLDWGLYWELRDYVKFNRDQRFRVKDEISQLIDWHRSEELPQYADQLEKLSKELKSGITVGQLEESLITLETAGSELLLKPYLPP